MVLSNLLENAVEYVNDMGTIHVGAKGSANGVEASIINTGCHLPPEDVPHVFERFWRGDKGRADTGVHYGLGLALVQRAVALYGGTADATVANGMSTVRLILPTAPLS
jgi:two-component system sensor histidine kinase VicK